MEKACFFKEDFDSTAWQNLCYQFGVETDEDWFEVMFEVYDKSSNEEE